MTVEDLCEAFSRTIGITYDLSVEEMRKTLFMRCDDNMTKDQVYAKMFLNAILYAANLSAQVTVSNLCCMGIITEEQLAGWELKPCIQPVRPSDREESPADQKEQRGAKGKVLDFGQMAIKVHREQ